MSERTIVGLRSWRISEHITYHCDAVVRARWLAIILLDVEQTYFECQDDVLGYVGANTT